MSSRTRNELRALVETKARLLRDGVEVIIPLAEVVPGDVALLSAGAMIPCDGRPSRLIALATLSVVIITALIPHLAFADLLGFVVMPPHFYPILALIILAYVAVAEATNALFYRKTGKA